MDEACGDVPYFTLEKEIVGTTQIGPRSYTVEYTIDVCNIGGTTGVYDLLDTPEFDDDVVIDAVRYSSDTPSNPGNPGPTTLVGDGPWTLADDADLDEGDCHAYILYVDVTMDLTDPNSPGDESYSECGSGGNADGSAGEGLYNTASLDTNNDGIQDVEDDACGDLPAISHDKNLTSITQTGARSFEVKYTITVENEGGAAGAYDLNDEVFFDDDIVTTCARYTSDAAGNPANPTEVALATSGLWNLADDQMIAANAIHTYCLIVCVEMDLNSLTTPGDGNYDACGSNSLNDPQRGEGLYNESYLDLDNDGVDDEEDEACGDLPYVYHEKEVVSFVPMPNGNNMVTYEICVYNTGGADGEFDLYDEPIFDDDIEIMAATYSCDVQGGGALPLPVPATPGWLLIDDQDISPNTSYCCTIEIEVDVDLSAGSSGDNVVTECGSTNGNGDSEPGEALHNESSLDVNNDGDIDEMDEACRDIFMITHDKTIATVEHNPDDSYCVTWNILVENMSSESGFYDLYDWPQFDEDFIMLSANYSSSVHPFTNLTTPPPTGGWQFADDINIAANGRHIYTLEICMIMDLKDPMTPGDADYTSCGELNGGTGEPGEGLFNQTLLDINDDGTADEIDDVCVDIPYVTHEKDFIDAVRNADGTYTATFKITVQNIGGATGDYDLWDQPAFDNDFVINSAEYTTDAIGHSANPGPESLPISGQWDLADDQTIDAGETQCYNLSVNVTINLSDPDTEGDEIYTFCGTANGADDPVPGEGFYNESFLDRSNDGDPEENEETCGDVDIVDLAIRKETVTQPPYAYGQVIEFRHTIFNQGNVDMYNVELADYLPAGFGFAGVAGNDAAWTQTSPTLIEYASIPGPIVPNDSAIVTLFLEILPTTGGNSDWWNYSEITYTEDEDMNDRSDEDVDSNIDDDPDNDNQPDLGDDDDDEITEGGPDAGEDEDDHDVAGIEIFDLAQRKTIPTDIVGTMASFFYGDTIPFTIEVFNQGSETATDIVVLDHIPCGYIYNASNDAAGWVYDGTGIASITIAGPLQPGTSMAVMIDLTLQQCLDMDEGSFTNVAEITDGDGEDGEPGDDIDSAPDGDPDNDGDPNDDSVDDPNDEDDHDPEEIAIFDLALIKQIVTEGPYAYGDLLEFKITVCNQGNQTVQNVNVIDYLPAGYSFDSADQTTPWTLVGAGPDVEYTIAGPLLEDTCIELPLFLTLEMTTGGVDNYTNVSEITDFEDENGDPQEDADSNPDNDPDNDGDPTDDSLDDPNDEDDHDPEIIEVFDLAQKKTTSTEAPYSYGDVIPFDITVYNQGNIAATNILINEHLPCGFLYTPDNDASGWTYDAATGIANATIAGPLTPGDSTVVTINVTLQQCLDMDESSFTNISEIGGADDEDGNPGDDIDSDSDDDPDNDGDPNDDSVDDPDDEDDHDPEEIAIFDLALIKQIVTEGPYAYGDLLEFKITICNQGNQTVQNVNVIDYLPAGYSFDSADQTTPWTIVGAGPDVEYIIAGPLLEDTCVEIPLFLTLEETTGGADNYTNVSEITDFEDENGDPQEDADSNPDNDPDNDGDPTDDSLDDPNDEDDHDPETVEIIDIAMRKIETTSGPYRYGDQLNFSHWIYNQGNVGLTNIVLNDFIPCGYDYDTNNDPIWSYDSVAGIATTTVDDLILPGDSIEVKFSLILKACTDPDAWKNISEIESFDDDNGDDRTDDDIDSNGDGDPDNDGDVVDDEIDNNGGDEDDNDPAEPEIFDLALIKTIDNVGPYTPGQIAMYDITVFNQGNVTAYNVEIVDYINAGYIFNAAANPGWTMTGANAYYTIPGPLAPGDQIIVTINLEVQVPPGADLSSWYNEAEITGGENEDGEEQTDADSTPDDDAFNDNDLVDGLDPDGIFDEDDLNDNEINNENGDEDDNDAAEILVTGEIGDFVWKDLNGDGVQDPGEPGIGGVVVRLFDCEGNFIRELTTDMNGYYLFDLLLPGGYQVQFDISSLPPGCAFTLPNQGDDDNDSDADLSGNTDCIDLEAGERNHSIDAGVLPLAKLGDTVFLDCNGNGVQDPGEEGVAGITVEVYDANDDLIKITTTNADGQYIVNGLYPGDYYVKFINGDYDFTINGAGGDTTADSDVDDSNGPGTTALVNLSAGECDLSSFDAGLYKCVALGELVWLDYNENDVWDSVENGINGLKVELYKFIDGSWVNYDYTYTGHKPGTPSDDGYFKFCVAPGRYYLRFLNPPNALVPAVSNFGINESVDSDVTGAFGPGTTSEINLVCGQDRCDIGAGYYKMGSIGDNVWSDDNNNGMRDSNEQGVADVIVRAYDVTGTQFGEAVTDNNGEYMIDYLGKNSYYLKFELPNGLAITEPNMGSDESMDSDVDGSNGPMTTDYYTISPGEHIPNVDAGVVLGVLSVEWLDVYAQNNDSHHTITWNVADQNNVSHYEVERSIDGLNNFESIAKVLSTGDGPEATSYTHDDYDIIAAGIYYYRIRQVDYDNAYDYSKVVSVDREDVVAVTNNSASIYPNPVVDELTLELDIAKPVTDLVVNIYDAQGKIARANAIMDIDLKSGTKSYKLNVTDFAKGVYSMKIKLDRKEIVKKLIIVD
jgi:uncharacterized repeat protein (TIGR01451 family)